MIVMAQPSFAAISTAAMMRWVGSAAADVAVHVLDNLRAARIFVRRQQFGGLHDLAGLAVAALRHLQLDPGLLQGVRGILRQPLDGDDLLAGRFRKLGLAGAHRLAVEMHGAGAAKPRAAAVFRAGQSDVIADHPKKRCVGRGVDRHPLVVQRERDHVSSSMFA
jgi:hypothetical protein